MADRLPVKLANESALGVYRFTWTSADGTRTGVLWAEGLGAPLMFRRGVAREIARPERFGWKTPKTTADFKRFAQAVADEFEAGYDDDELEEPRTGRTGVESLEDTLAARAPSAPVSPTAGRPGELAREFPGEPEPRPQVSERLERAAYLATRIDFSRDFPVNTHMTGPCFVCQDPVQPHRDLVAWSLEGKGSDTYPAVDLHPGCLADVQQARETAMAQQPDCYEFDVVSVTTVKVRAHTEDKARAMIDGLRSITTSTADGDIEAAYDLDVSTSDYDVVNVSPYSRGYLVNAETPDGKEVSVSALELIPQPILITDLAGLREDLAEAGRALAGDSNDAEHDILYRLAERLRGILDGSSYSRTETSSLTMQPGPEARHPGQARPPAGTGTTAGPEKASAKSKKTPRPRAGQQAPSQTRRRRQ